MRLAVLVLTGALAWAAGNSSLEVRDISGQVLRPFQPAGKAEALFFVSTDCPVSNTYAPEIQRICADYGTKGVACSLVYEDLHVDAKAVRKHLDDYRFRGIPAVIDATRAVARRAGASVTPQAVVVDGQGTIRYRGRINNLYADFGKRRPQATVEDLRDALDAVLAGKPVANPETKSLGCYIVWPETLKPDAFRKMTAEVVQ